MNNSRDRNSRVSRAAVAGALVGGSAACLREWQRYQQSEQTLNEAACTVIKETAKASLISGTVTAIYADEMDRVQAGAPLVQLDGADARIALAQAEAALGQAVRQVRTLYVNNDGLAAQVRLRDADVVKARNQLGVAQQDLARRQALGSGGAVSGEELAHARAQVTTAQTAVDAAQAAVVTAREQLTSNRALTEGTPVEQHPSVLAAAAKVREAWIAAHRMTLPAPVSGYVSKRNVQLGQRVAPGAPLMAVVPLDTLWVDANFKENQLRNLRLGQPVKMTADLYGKKVEYKGTIAGMGVGTGSAFALLPAQNATGNWIKVVQRVPVRIALDAEQLKANPLRVGLSMDVTVDTQDRNGHMLADAPRTQAVAQTAVYDALDQGAAEEVARIIAANAGAGYKPSVAAASQAADAPVAKAAGAQRVASAASKAHGTTATH